MAITIPLALGLGSVAAIWRGSIFDRAISSAAIMLVSPNETAILHRKGLRVRRE
jgi:peptide/nickel transport system permease protein